MAKKTDPLQTPKNQFKHMTPEQEEAEIASLDSPIAIRTGEQPTEMTVREGEDKSGFTVVDPAPTDQPKEGDKKFFPNGDWEEFHNGAWIVKVQPNPHTGQDSQL